MAFERIDSIQDAEERIFLEKLNFHNQENERHDVKTRFGWLSTQDFAKFASFYTWRELEQAPFSSGIDRTDGCIYRWYKDGRKQLMVDASGKVVTPANVFLDY